MLMMYTFVVFINMYLFCFLLIVNPLRYSNSHFTLISVLLTLLTQGEDLLKVFSLQSNPLF